MSFTDSRAVVDLGFCVCVCVCERERQVAIYSYVVVWLKNFDQLYKIRP